MTDYAAMYEGYWSDPSRWGTSSLRDVGETAEAVLACCGGGRVLDVGCGMGALVRALLRAGVDAVGLDVAARCVEEGNRGAPGRFVRGSMLELPFADGEVETVVSTDVLEHLGEEDVGRAIAEMARVARRGVFIRVATTPDRDGAWHLTVKDRAWWERKCFEAGLRRHPMMLAAVGYEGLEAEGWQATLVMEKVPSGALARWPLEALRAERDLHMDMLREAGRRSDAHLARYWLACEFVRPGDVVLDVACGLGYGSAVIGAGSQAGRVLGVDESGFAVEYAEGNYGATARLGGQGAAALVAQGGGDRFWHPDWALGARERRDADRSLARSAPGIEFRRGDAAELGWLADASVDVVVSFETLEHLREPGKFLDEVRRVLRPGGRVVVSVPARWVDETGRDPNPHHLQVYDWERLRGEVAARFIVEKRYAQVAGGGMKLKEGARKIREIGVAAGEGDEGAEWWLAVGMKEPVGAGREGYEEHGLPDHSGRAGFNVAAFGRDYENPWLVRAMVALGLRCTSKAELGAMAGRVLERAERGEVGAASADVGAALCVLGYRLLEGGAVAASEAVDWHVRNRAFERAVEGAGEGATAHARRWVISNAYVAAQLMLATGARRDARREFQRCAAMDVLGFSPLLASKTIDASWQAGVIAACDGDVEGATADFRRGLSELVRVLGAGDWANIIGSVEEPLPFGLVDLQQGVEFASRCAFGVAWAGMFRDRPGLAWQLVRRRSMADLREWSERQQGAMQWLREQRREYERALADAREWIATQEKGRVWLEQNAASLSARLETVERNSSDERERLRGTIEELKRGAEWQAGQRRELEERVRERDATIAELRGFVESQKAGEKWLAGQKKELEQRLAERDARIAEMQGKITKLMETRDWALKQAASARARAERPGGSPARAGPEGSSPP